MADGDFPQQVREAIQDELGAVEFYARLAQQAHNPAMKAIIMSIMADEYGHARTWLTMSELMRSAGVVMQPHPAGEP
ncbi:MAG TPA: hypothetical protein VF234_03880 [Limnochordia bacterium]